MSENSRQAKINARSKISEIAKQLNEDNLDEEEEVEPLADSSQEFFSQETESILSTDSDKTLIEYPFPLSNRSETEQYDDIFGSSTDISSDISKTNTNMSSALRNITKQIHKYDGVYDNLLKFMESIRIAIASENLTGEAGDVIKTNIIKYIIVNCLDNKLYQALKNKTIVTVDELQENIRNELLLAIEPDHILAKINACEMGRGTIEDYAIKFKRLLTMYQDLLVMEKINLEHIREFQEKTMIRSFIRGVHSDLRTLLLSQKFATLDDCITWARTKEHEIGNRPNSKETNSEKILEFEKKAFNKFINQGSNRNSNNFNRSFGSMNIKPNYPNNFNKNYQTNNNFNPFRNSYQQNSGFRNSYQQNSNFRNSPQNNQAYNQYQPRNFQSNGNFAQQNRGQFSNPNNQNFQNHGQPSFPTNQNFQFNANSNEKMVMQPYSKEPDNFGSANKSPQYLNSKP
jgi:hypothetical protein